jgi:hypothetical protein
MHQPAGAVTQEAIVMAGGHRPLNRIRSPYQAGLVAGSTGGYIVHSKPFPRYVGGAWRLLLCAFLVAALGPVARVRSAPPGGGFELGALGTGACAR